MWKYLSSDQEKDFLLSLHLIDGKNDSEIIKKIYTISNNKEKNYHIYKIKKRNGTYRTIYEPNLNLKIIQENILHNILEQKHISKYAKAYKKGINLIENAKPHLNQKIILKLDIRNFFDSIAFTQIYNACFPIEYFPESIGILLTNLCTCYDTLPQGTKTAPYISNLVLQDFDNTIGSYCESQNIAYTRYCDDMTFSGGFNYHQVIKLVRQELSKLGLTLNNDKIRVITRKNRQVVTGIVVNEKLQVNSNYRKKIRQEIYYISKYGLYSHLKKSREVISKEKYLNVLLGKINFVLQINKNDKEFIKYQKYIINLIKKNTK